VEDDAYRVVLPVPATMRLEMVVDLQIGVLDGKTSSLFSKEPFEKEICVDHRGFRFAF